MLSEPDTPHSPTITKGMTQPGVVLGTAAYMSSEQAKGKAVDKRADIWAFGCILYEWAHSLYMAFSRLQQTAFWYTEAEAAVGLAVAPHGLTGKGKL